MLIKSINCSFPKKNTKNPSYYSNHLNNTNFCGKRSNYTGYSDSHGGEIPIIVEPGVSLRRYKDTHGKSYPGFKIDGADFSGGDLILCYMKGSTITNSDLSHVRMEHIKLHDSNLQGCNFEDTYAIDSIFNNSDFTNCNLAKMNASYSNFQNCIFKNANLDETNLQNCNLMGADLSEAKNLENAKLDSAIYDNETKFPPSFEIPYSMVKFAKGSNLGPIFFPPKTVRKGDVSHSVEQDDFSDIQCKSVPWNWPKFDGADFSGLIFDNCVFERLSGKKTNFSKCSLYGTTFEKCDLSGANFNNALFDSGTKFLKTVNLQRANLLGVNLSNSGIEKLYKYDGYLDPLAGAIYNMNTIFPKGFDPKEAGMIFFGGEENYEGLNLSGMSFREDRIGGGIASNFKNINFKKCDFKNADLSEIDLQESDFTHAYMKQASLKNANCKGAKFFDAQMYGADLRGADMRETDLRWAKMEEVKTDEKTDFSGAVYNDDTVFPADFPEKLKAKMIFVPRFITN